MNLDVSRASSFGSWDWAVYGEVGSNKMDRASSASNLDENFTPTLLNYSNAVRSLGYIQSTQSDRLGPRPTAAFVCSCFWFPNRLLLQDIGGDMTFSSPSLQYC